MDALVLHPNTGWNTFTDVAGADAIADNMLDHAVWEALSSDDKQRWLLATGTMIKGLNGIEFPDTAVGCLGVVQVEIAVNILKHGLNEVEADQQIRIQYFNRISTEFFKNEFADGKVTPDIPYTSWGCLEALGAIKPSYAGGVGTVRHHR